MTGAPNHHPCLNRCGDQAFGVEGRAVLKHEVHGAGDLVGQDRVALDVRVHQLLALTIRNARVHPPATL